MRKDLPALTAGELAQSRRRLIVDGIGIAVSALAFGFVNGLAAEGAGLSPIEAVAMSVIVFAGAAQFAAIGYMTGGLAWPAIVLISRLGSIRADTWTIAAAGRMAPNSS